MHAVPIRCRTWISIWCGGRGRSSLCTSGFAYVASSFGIPTSMVNALSSVGLLWSGDTRFALKPVHTRDGRMLSLSDVTSEKWRWAFPTYETVQSAELVVGESSADEILETTKEALDLSSGALTILPVDDDWKTRHRSRSLRQLQAGPLFPGEILNFPFGRHAKRSQHR